MYKRWQEDNLKDALETRRVVILSGARQCGKTTLAKSLNSDKRKYITLDDVTLYNLAKNDPQPFVKIEEGTLVIDEIQKVPELITAIKKAVDENLRYGQYLITGSVNIQKLPTVKESLAGRVRKVRLRPLAQGEILQNSPKFIQRIKKCDFINNKTYDKEQVSKLIYDGGYPEPLQFKINKSKRIWFNDYLNSIIENDLSDIANIRRQDYLKDTLSILASFSSKFIDKSKITSSLGISIQTLEKLIGVLENTYLVDRLYPWLKSDYERVNKQCKYFITDTGLMSAMLNWNLKDIFLDQDKSGKAFETYVYTQLISYVELESYEYSLSHYRDRNGHEVDFILEDSSNHIYGIEVKSGSSLSKDSAKHLKWFRDNLIKDKKFLGIVLYTGEYVVPISNDIYAVPINNLWE